MGQPCSQRENSGAIYLLGCRATACIDTIDSEQGGNLDPLKGKSVGMPVITTLVGRLKATVTFENEGRGPTFSIARG